MVGFTLSSEAQTMNYYLYNSSTTDTWHFKMDDAGAPGVVTELNIAPGTSRSGAMDLFSHFHSNGKLVMVFVMQIVWH